VSYEFIEKIDEDFPFSKVAKKANIMAVYCYYQEKKYDKIIEIIDNFMQINSGDLINTPYMLYMKGIVYYNQISGPYLSEDYANKASIAFRELRARFPASIYRQDIENKLTSIDENIAGRKMNIARYQMKNLNIKLLFEKSLWLRKEIFEMVIKINQGHIASALSQCEIIISLFYGGILRYKKGNPNNNILTQTERNDTF
jgi:hypothetical protein